jgi:hypothetical protein
MRLDFGNLGLLFEPMHGIPDRFFLGAVDVFLAIPLTLQLSHSVFQAFH